MPALSAKNASSAGVFEDVSLDVESGEIIMLHGGYPGQVLLQCLSGLRPVSEGTVTLGGEPLEGNLGEVRRSQAGFFLPGGTLLSRLTVKENLQLRGNARFDETVETTQTGHLLSRYPHQLTEDEALLVTWARALVPGPAVVFGSEIFMGVDSEFIAEAIRISASAMDQAVVLAANNETLATIADHSVGESGLPASLDEMAPPAALPANQAHVISRAQAILDELAGPLFDPKQFPEEV